MAARIPTVAEAEALAAALVAAGYPPAEAAANYRNAFPADDPDGVDGCLMFEGPNIRLAERVADQWAGANGTDAWADEYGSWLNAAHFSALLTLAATGGEPEALTTRASDLAYIRENWK